MIQRRIAPRVFQYQTIRPFDSSDFATLHLAPDDFATLQLCNVATVRLRLCDYATVRRSRIPTDALCCCRVGVQGRGVESGESGESSQGNAIQGNQGRQMENGEGRS
jgi:hypothetical protein